MSQLKYFDQQSNTWKTPNNASDGAGGASGQIQYNDGGLFKGSPKMTFDGDIVDFSGADEVKLPDDSVGTNQMADGAVTESKMDDTGWLPITPAAGYTSVGAAARKIGGVIYLKGQLSKTSGNVALNDQAGTLPVGCRPNYQTITCGFISNSSNFFKGVINNVGDYGITVLNQISGTSGSYICLDSISFPEKD